MLSNFTVGFSSWSFINTSEQYSYFNVYASTGTVIDISDCITLNGEITNIDKRLNGTYDVTITHEDGYISMYIDLGSVNYSVGDKVEQGNNLGKVSDNMDYLEFVIIKDNVRLENTKDLIVEN